MGRTVSGHRHEIIYEFAMNGGITKVQATCVCGIPVGPPRFGREQAEEDGREHLYVFVETARFKKRGK